jgi:molybdopterin/thiamine biosynthesis adenylyltransferase
VTALAGRAVLVLGANGAGAAAALALAGSGVGRLVVADGAAVEPWDLAAHPLLGEADVGRSRAEATAAALARRFPALAVEAAAPLGEGPEAAARARAAEAVLDATNRFEAMFAACDAAVAAGRPLVHAGLVHWSLQLATVLPGVTGCLRCLFEAPPPPLPAEAAAPAPLAALAGALLAEEALRLLAGEPGAYAGKVMTYDARPGRARAAPLPRRAGCRACGPLPAAAPGDSGAVPAAGGAP